MNRVVILMYHIVAEPLSAQEARYCCTLERFESHMRHLAQSGIPLVTLDAITDALDGRTAWPNDGIGGDFRRRVCRHVRQCDAGARPLRDSGDDVRVVR